MVAAPSFHTPPNTLERSVIAEQESYGLIKDQDQDQYQQESGPVSAEESVTTTTLSTDGTHDESEQSSLSEDTGSDAAKCEAKEVGVDMAMKDHQNQDKPPAKPQRPQATRATSTASTVNNIGGIVGMPKRLPSRLAHYIDLFLHSLQEPKYMTPLTGDDIGSLYQDFYKRFAGKAEEWVIGKSGSSFSSSEVPMKSFEEIAEKKKERSQRPAKVNALVELGEAKACSLVYEKIFSVSHGGDIQKNVKVEQKAAALKALPITLVDLGLNGYADTPCIQTMVDEAGEELHKLNAAKWPKAKLDHLLAVHQIIVKILSEEDKQLGSSNSSADAILPCLIYVLIMSETPDIWLNLKFMHRFRNVNYLNGESMYCLTNFEAAATFLETASAEALGIDLAAVPAGVDINCLLQPDPLRSGTSSPGSINNQPAKGTSSTRGSRSNSVNKDQVNRNNRRHSLLQLHYPSDIATSAADLSIKSIGSTFGNSYRFLMGKLGEKKADELEDSRYPHTLAEARQVVGLEPPASPSSSLHDTYENASDSASVHSRDHITPQGSISSMAELLRGAPQASPEKLVAFPTTSTETSVLGKWTGGMMRSIRSSSTSGITTSTSAPQQQQQQQSPAVINERFLTADFDSLKISDLRELLVQYKRLAAHVKSSQHA